MTLEHDLIKRYFAPLCSRSNEAPAFGLEDDTALLKPGPSDDLLITMDALVAGIHFFPDDPPKAIAHKALAVNVSDIVAKGGLPASYLMTIALPPHVEADWLCEFARGLQAAQDGFACQLIGGDTVSTSGPLMISITLLGEVACGKMVRRKGARPGDIVFVSGTIGDAALGLLLRTNDQRMVKARLDKAQINHLLERYLYPRPRLELAPLIASHASAAMDISDGLMGDFAKLCAVSGVGGVVEAARVPLVDAATSALAQVPDLLETVLGGGDDYEILFTVAASQAAEFEKHAGNGTVTRIGKITARAEGVKALDAQGQALDLAQSAFDHFADTKGPEPLSSE